MRRSMYRQALSVSSDVCERSGVGGGGEVSAKAAAIRGDVVGSRWSAAQSGASEATSGGVAFFGDSLLRFRGGSDMMSA
jgi:hypothetical protein